VPAVGRLPRELLGGLDVVGGVVVEERRVAAERQRADAGGTVARSLVRRTRPAGTLT
jgi:hypothetical protein